MGDVLKYIENNLFNVETPLWHFGNTLSQFDITKIYVHNFRLIMIGYNIE